MWVWGSERGGVGCWLAIYSFAASAVLMRVGVEHERAKRAEQKTASAQKKKERKASEAAQKKAAKERRASQDRTAKGYPKTSAEEMDKILGEIKESKARLQKMEEEGRKREAEEIREKEEEARKEKKKKQEAEELRKKVEEELMEEARKKEQEEVELLQQIAKFKRRAKVVEPTVKGEERLKKEGGEDTEEDEEEKISWQILKSRAEQRAALEARKKEAEEAMKRGAEEAKEREAKEAKKRDAEEKKSKKEAQEAQEAREVQRKWAKELHRERMRAEEEEKKRKRRPSVPEFEFSTPYLSDRTGTRQRNVRIGCPPDTSSGARWSGEEVQYMKSQRAAGLSWRDVAVAVNEKFGTGRSVSACSSKSYREP